MNPQQFLRLIIRRVLDEMAISERRLASPVAEALLLGTALTESGLVWLKQHPTGPALGVYQMEPRTHDDVWVNWLKFRPDQERMIRSFTLGDPMAGDMVWNLAYATAMARIHYWRVRAPLPQLDASGLADYHKAHYNTTLGATSTSKSVVHFQRAIDIVAEED
jgi:hypothetical protein